MKIKYNSQGGCERRIEVFVKIQKKIYIFFFFLGGGVRYGEGSGQGDDYSRREGSWWMCMKN